MNIDLKNYCIYIVDYCEGLLTVTEQKELFEFLDKHPHLKKELESYKQSEKYKLPSETLDSSFKIQLKKISSEPIGRINRNNIDTFLVKELEGELTQIEKIELADFIKVNPLFQKDRNLYKSSVLEPDQHITLSKDDKRILSKIATVSTQYINRNNAEEWMISYFEKLLNPTQEKELLEFVRLNPTFQTDFELYKQSYLTTDKKVIYTGKLQLKQLTGARYITPLYRRLTPYFSVAAAACLIVYFGFFNQSDIAVNVSSQPLLDKIQESPVTIENSTVNTPINSSASVMQFASTSPKTAVRMNQPETAQVQITNPNTIVAKTDSGGSKEFNIVRLHDIEQSAEDIALENRIKQQMRKELLEQYAKEQNNSQQVLQVNGNSGSKFNWDRIAERAESWMNKNSNIKVRITKNQPQNVNPQPIIIGNSIIYGGF